jgi:hypothetical protein
MKTWKLRKTLFYVILRILLPIQIQLSDIENPKNPKIDSPTVKKIPQRIWTKSATVNVKLSEALHLKIQE